MSNFCGTEIEIWAGIGPVGSTDLKKKYCIGQIILKCQQYAYFPLSQ